jgi:hypothetical protein
VRFGLSHHVIERAHIESAERAHWPLIAGIGWRIGPGVLGLIGSLHGIVKLELSHPYTHHVLALPLKYTQLYLSMEDADAFLADLLTPR